MSTKWIKCPDCGVFERPEGDDWSVPCLCKTEGKEEKTVTKPKVKVEGRGR